MDTTEHTITDLKVIKEDNHPVEYSVIDFEAFAKPRYRFFGIANTPRASHMPQKTTLL